jgi:REP element-mobilizing transposase RayT
MSYEQLLNGRFSGRNHEYLVTTVTHCRRRMFEDFGAACTLCRVMRETADAGMGEWLAWVVMPNHVHALLRLNGQADLDALMRAIKGRSARLINKRIGSDGPLRQYGFHDHALRSEEDRVAIARYIVANPVRAGLVGRVGDYPHWDCVWL